MGINAGGTIPLRTPPHFGSRESLCRRRLFLANQSYLDGFHGQSRRIGNGGYTIFRCQGSAHADDPAHHSVTNSYSNTLIGLHELRLCHHAFDAATPPMFRFSGSASATPKRIHRQGPLYCPKPSWDCRRSSAPTPKRFPFNTAANWVRAPARSARGDGASVWDVHRGGRSNMLMIRGNGASGNPITVLSRRERCSLPLLEWNQRGHPVQRPELHHHRWGVDGTIQTTANARIWPITGLYGH